MLPAVYDQLLTCAQTSYSYHPSLFSPNLYCPKQAPISMQVPTAHVTHEINFTFCTSISTYLCLPAYLSTYANLTAPVLAEGAIHETVMELLFVALLWVIALCNNIIVVHLMASILQALKSSDYRCVCAQICLFHATGLVFQIYFFCCDQKFVILVASMNS